MKPLRIRSLIVGGASGVIIGLCVAAAFTIADWKLNPGGIFHDAMGTQWRLVLETGLSWFLPVGLLVFSAVTTFHYWLFPSDVPRDEHTG